MKTYVCMYIPPLHKDQHYTNMYHLYRNTISTERPLHIDRLYVHKDEHTTSTGGPLILPKSKEDDGLDRQELSNRMYGFEKMGHSFVEVDQGLQSNL